MAKYRGKELPAGIDAPTDSLKSSERAKISKLKRLNQKAKTDAESAEAIAAADLADIEREARSGRNAIRRARGRVATGILLNPETGRVNEVEMAVVTENAWKAKVEWLAGLAFRDANDSARNQANLAARAAAAWVELVGSAATQHTISTGAQWEKLLASVYAQLNATLYKHMSQETYPRVAQAAIIRNEYLNALLKLTEHHFTLFVNDSDAIPPLLRNEKRLRYLSDILKERAQEILRNSLMDAIEEAAAGLTAPGQWPRAYTDLLLNRVREIGEPGGVIEGFKIYGEDIRSWRISVNFFDLFGDEADLNKGYHFGAIAGLRTGPLDRGKKYGDDVRIHLPYMGQILRNPTSKRYLFFKAIANKQTIFYGRYKASAGGGMDKYGRVIPPRTAKENAIRGRRAAMDYQHSENLKEKKTIKQWSREALRNRQITAVLHYDRKISRLDAANDRIRRAHGRADTETRGIRIPKGLWDNTVAARFQFWNRQGLAPVWLLLEFGQLVWQPIIPPRMLIYRFLMKSRQALDEEFRMLINAELQTAGLMRTSSGNIRASGTVIRFGPAVGQSRRRGTFVSERKMFEAMSRSSSIARRNIEEAMSVGARMPSPMPSYRQDWSPTSSPKYERAQPAVSTPFGPEKEDIWYGYGEGPSTVWVERGKMAVRRNIPMKTYTPNFGESMAALARQRRADAERDRKLAEIREEIHMASRTGETLSGYRNRKAKEKRDLDRALARQSRLDEKAAEKARTKRPRGTNAYSGGQQVYPQRRPKR